MKKEYKVVLVLDEYDFKEVVEKYSENITRVETQEVKGKETK